MQLYIRCKRRDIMKNIKYLQYAFLIVGVLAVFEFIFVRGMFSQVHNPV